MERKEYSAGAVKLALWFAEFRKVVEWLSEGVTLEEVKELAIEQNLFSASSPRRSKQIATTITERVRTLDLSFVPVFIQGDLSTQKLFSLVAAMTYDTLLFDFVNEILREKLILGTNEFTDNDIRTFLKNKALQSDKIASWTEGTTKNLIRSYKSMLTEAGVIEKGRQTRQIIKPILEPAMENWMKDQGLAVVAKALTGER